MTSTLKKLAAPLVLLALLAAAQAQETAPPGETGAGTGQAQETAPPRETGAGAGQTQAQADEDTGETVETPRGAAGSAEAFIPTETISEDLSVPFPVDI
jgi:hypothetical protein